MLSYDLTLIYKCRGYILIVTVLLPNGTTVPKIFCRAFPDKDKEFHNVLAFDEMEDKLFLIRDKWEDYQYDVNRDGPSAKALEIDEYEGEIWGLMIRDDWHLIGNVFIFMDSMAMLLGTLSDEAPIVDTKGKEQGKLVYSLDLKINDKDGNPKDCFMVDSIKDCYGDEMEVTFAIHQAKGIPKKYCNEVFSEYQWIDDMATMFSTDRVVPKKNDNNPLFNYKKTHYLKVDNYVMENLSNTTCIISVYGKLTEENMQGLYKDFNIRPDTAQVARATSEFKSDTFYDAALGRNSKQNVLKIDEVSDKSDDTEKYRAREEEEKRLRELNEELEKINQQNEKLKKEISLMKGTKAGC